MVSARQMLPVIIAVLQLHQLSFSWMLNVSRTYGDREAAIALFSMQLEHKSLVGDLYLNYHVSREYWILPRLVLPY